MKTTTLAAIALAITTTTALAQDKPAFEVTALGKATQHCSQLSAGNRLATAMLAGQPAAELAIAQLDPAHAFAVKCNDNRIRAKLRRERKKAERAAAASTCPDCDAAQNLAPLAVE